MSPIFSLFLDSRDRVIFNKRNPHVKTLTLGNWIIVCEFKPVMGKEIGRKHTHPHTFKITISSYAWDPKVDKF